MCSSVAAHFESSNTFHRGHKTAEQSAESAAHTSRQEEEGEGDDEGFGERVVERQQSSWPTANVAQLQQGGRSIFLTRLVPERCPAARDEKFRTTSANINKNTHTERERGEKKKHPHAGCRHLPSTPLEADGNEFAYILQCKRANSVIMRGP